MYFEFFLTNVLPILSAIGIAVIGYILAGLNKRIDRAEERIDKVETRLDAKLGKLEDASIDLNARLGRMEGMLQMLAMSIMKGSKND